MLASTLRGLWRRLPNKGRLAIVRTGLPYAASFVSHYGETQRIANFAGNLAQLKAAYSQSGAERRAEQSRQFDRIVDALVMPNAVKKTTYANRLTQTLSAVLSAVQLPRPDIRVLDLPSSTGISSIENLVILRERYRVSCYVLGDLYHRIIWDPRRRCIFDAQGRLLQVAFTDRFFSLYRGHTSGEEHTFLSACLLFPHSLAAWYLRKRHPFARGNEYQDLLVVHPDVEPFIEQGVCRLEEMDIFQPIAGQFDLILSFNLLQRNYFPADIIEAGVKNLAASLSEGGLIIMGNTESFTALQKQDGQLVARLQKGTF